ncbi:MAG: hypothetical protein ACOYXT_27930 [Bacteroidota bacterium]
MESTRIPMFPLTLLPLPGELIPLHIFEPRYRELLTDVETRDISFGIYFNHEINKSKLGSLMKLESVIKRYPEGESDIIVRCIDIFSMDTLYRTYGDRLYPGGDVRFHNINVSDMPGVELYELFLEYQNKRNISSHFTLFTLYQIAHEMNFDLTGRYQFLNASTVRKENFLIRQLKFHLHVLRQEEKSKDVYHLN